MNSQGRLLLVDDEETFRLSTADLLRLEGYVVDTAIDASGAWELMGRHAYDLIVADIQMPGNSQLEFIKALPQKAPGTPVILATGYPSTDTAIEAVGLPVVAYLVKPVDLDVLKQHCRVAVDGMQAYRAVGQARQRMADWQNHLDALRQSWAQAPGPQSGAVGPSFVQLTLQNILQSVMDLNQLGLVLSGETAPETPCPVKNCPSLSVLKAAVVEAIEVLEQTKQAFKSKQLYALRQKLEATLEEVAELNL